MKAAVFTGALKADAAAQSRRCVVFVKSLSEAKIYFTFNFTYMYFTEQKSGTGSAHDTGCEWPDDNA